MNFIVRLADYSWQKIFLIALVLCAAYYFFQFDDGISIAGQVEQAQMDLQQEKTLLAKTIEAMKDLERFKEELNNQEAQVKEVMSFLPKQMNVSDLLSTIQDRANQAGMRVLKLNPKEEITKVEFYEAMRVEIQLQGTYAQIATFLSLLSKLPRLLTIDNITLVLVPSKEPDGSAKIDFGATLVSYRYADEQKADGEKSN